MRHWSRKTSRLSVEPLEARTLLDGAPVAFAAGDEFLVNSYRAGDQRFHDASPQGVAMDADGDAVVVWASQGEEGDDWGVFAQRYTSDGSPAGEQFQVNNYTTKGQYNASVAMDADGDFVITWSSRDQDGDNYGIYARRYDAAGQALGGEFRVNQTTAGVQRLSSIAADAEGNVVIVWRSTPPGVGEYDRILGRLFDSDGAPLGDEFLINEPSAELAREPHVARNPQGDFVVVWMRGNTVVNDPRAGQDVYARTFDAHGSPQSAEFRVHDYTLGQQIRPTVAMSAAGTVAIAWFNQALFESVAESVVPRDVYLHRFTKDGVSLGPDMLVNASVSPPQQHHPSIAMDAEGNFTVVWASLKQDNQPEQKNGIYRQSFAANGDKIGSETLVNQTIAGDQTLPSIGMNANGDFLVAWTDFGSTAIGDLVARRFAHNDDLAPPTIANVYVDGDDHAIAEGERLLQMPTRIVATFSEAIDAEPSANSRTRWRLLHNGVDETERLDHATHIFNGAANRYEAILELNAPLPAGDYVLQALPTIRDLAGHALDGDRDGIGGDAFERRFTITSPASDDGAVFRLNDGAAGDQSFAGGAPGTIARDAAGNLVAVWTENSTPSKVWMRRFNAEGVPLSGDELVSALAPSENQSQAAVAMAPDGRFVIAWTSRFATSSGFQNDIYARRYFATGDPVDLPFLVNETTSVDQERPSVAINAGGEFVVAWQSTGLVNGSGFEIVMQRFGRDGARLGRETQINDYTVANQVNPTVAMNARGDVALAWLSATPGATVPTRVAFRRYIAAEDIRGSECIVDRDHELQQSNPSISMDESGHVVVAWQSNENGTDDIFARRFDVNDKSIGEVFRVNAVDAGAQQLPAAAIDQNGDIAIAWQSLRTGAGQTRDIAMRRFAWNGEPQDESDQVFEVEANQTSPNLAMSPNGNFTLAWTDGTLGSRDLFARNFASLVNALPVAVAGGPYELSEGGSVLLNAGLSLDPDAAPGDALRFDWDLDGDGAFDDLVNAAASKAVEWASLAALGIRDDGVYPIRLRVTDALGATAVDDATLLVNNTAPSGVALDSIATLNEGASFTLTGNFADPGLGDAHTIRIEWEPGAVESIEIPAGDRNFSLTHTYLDDGAFSARVAVMDDDGGVSDVAIAPITVRNVAPTLLGTPQPEPTVFEGNPWTIIGYFADAGILDTHTVTMLWGDGTTSPAVVDQAVDKFTASHVYLNEQAGPVNVQYIVRDGDGGTIAGSAFVTVLNAPPTIPSLRLSPDSVAVGELVTLTGAIHDDGVVDTNTVFIEWGDDEPGEVIFLGRGATDFLAQHVYAAANPVGGPYLIRVEAVDSGNGVAQREIAVDVADCGLVGDTDLNCAVDLDDLNAVRNNFGATAQGGGRVPGDAFPFDGVVDLNDLNAVRNNFGATAAPVNQSAPPAPQKPHSVAAAQDAVFASWSRQDAEFTPQFWIAPRNARKRLTR